MRVLVTGAGGFVGKRLTKRLASEGHEVVALLHADPAPEDRDWFHGDRISVVRSDVRSVDFATLPTRIEAVVTLAQSSRFRDFPNSAEYTFEVNVTANLRLLQWAIGAGVRRVVHASSGGVYGGRKAAEFQETDLLSVDSPLGFYLGTKLCAEVVFQNYRQFFTSLVVLRPFFIYGPGQRKDMFVARIIENVRQGVPIQLQGAEGLRINPVYVDDAVTAFARALDIGGCHIFNVAGPDTVSLRALAELVGVQVKKRPLFDVDATAEPVDYVGTTTQADKVLGRPKVRLAEGVAQAAAIAAEQQPTISRP